MLDPVFWSLQVLCTLFSACVFSACLDCCRGRVVRRRGAHGFVLCLNTLPSPLSISLRFLSQVLSAVSEAGQFEVAIRLVQQMRAAGDVPSKVSG